MAPIPIEQRLVEDFRSNLKTPDPTVVEEDWGDIGPITYIIGYTLSVKKSESEPEAGSGISKQTKNIVVKKDEKINIPEQKHKISKVKIHKNKNKIK